MVDYESYRQQQLRLRAEKRVKAKISFYWHLASYVIVNATFVAAYYVTVEFFNSTATEPWFLWVMLSWGIGLLFHAVAVYLIPMLNTTDFDRMVDHEMTKMNKPMGHQYPELSHEEREVIAGNIK